MQKDHAPALRRTLPARLRAVAACCLAAALSQPVHADLVVKDEGERGVVLSNLDGPAPAAAPIVAMHAAPAAAPRRMKPQASQRRRLAFAPLVREVARAHDVPEALLQALIEVESGFDPAAVSPKGALGLMQLMPQTARELRVRDARDPAANLHGGTRYLSELLARYRNDLVLALAAYNAGPRAVERAGGIPRNAETQAYVPRVIARYHQLQSGSD